MTGAWTWYRENDELMQTGAFDEDERKTGVWNRYHPNGALHDEGEYAAGSKTGEWKVYDSDGSLLRTTRHGGR
jgi:antitoxin component YwqK of YwqJK toxin-antitoxin module